jgi:hypothetical protein
MLTSNRKGELTDKTLELASAKDFVRNLWLSGCLHNNKQLDNPGRETATFSSLPAGIAHPTIEDAAVWVDKFGESAEMLSDTAMAAAEVDYSKVDPSTYADIFSNPSLLRKLGIIHVLSKERSGERHPQGDEEDGRKQGLEEDQKV